MTSKEAWSFCSRLLISGSPGTLVSGVDAGNGRNRKPTRQGLRPAEILQALTQLLTHAQHTKLHRMLTTRVCNTVYHQCSLYQTLFTQRATTLIFRKKTRERERERERCTCTRQYDRRQHARNLCSMLRKIKRSMYMHRRKDRASMDSAPECKARIWYELVLV